MKIVDVCAWFCIQWTRPKKTAFPSMANLCLPSWRTTSDVGSEHTFWLDCSRMGPKETNHFGGPLKHRAGLNFNHDEVRLCKAILVTESLNLDKLVFSLFGEGSTM